MKTKARTIKALAALLKTKFTGRDFPKPDCSNHRVGTGYCVPGRAKWTRAIHESGIGCAYNWWSGSAATPSTQIPIEVADYLRSADTPMEANL